MLLLEREKIVKTLIKIKKKIKIIKSKQSLRLKHKINIGKTSSDPLSGEDFELVLQL